MIEFRIRIDVENLRMRLSRRAGEDVGEEGTIAWLNRAGIRRDYPHSPLCWVAAEEALELLCPWEILERLPLVMLPAETLGLQAGFH